MTSNVGAHEIQRETTIGFQIQTDEKASYESMKTKVMDELRRTFRPEFLNRIDEIIVFHALNKEQLKSIVEIMVRDLQEQLKLRDVHLRFTEDAKVLLADKGYNPEYGARPLRRAIQRLVEDPLSGRDVERYLQGRRYHRGRCGW